ncbi:MAG: tetratricopeptide repeat protein [Gemmatimonadota bacterium]
MAIDPRTSGARRRRLPYWASYGVVALILTAVTAFFALVVLPQRFVLHAGLRESGISFPARRPGFAAVSRGRIVQPPPRRIPPAAPGEGPAERFWRGILPLLETGRYEKALPLFRQYLEHHPEDTDVWREYALALIRAGRPAEAEAAIEHLGAPNDRLAARLALARFWRDRGETDRAIEAYRDLVMAYPENRTLRRELARALSWAERYDEAAQVFAELLGQDREDEALRLELARVLYWAGRLPEAREVLAGISPDSREAAEAVALDGRLAELLARRPPSPPVDEPPVVRARRAAAEGDLEAA